MLVNLPLASLPGNMKEDPSAEGQHSKFNVRLAWDEDGTGPFKGSRVQKFKDGFGTEYRSFRKCGILGVFRTNGLLISLERFRSC